MNITEITLKDEVGNDIVFDIVYDFYSEEFNKSYILLEPVEGLDEEDDETTIYPYSYTLDENGDIDQLLPIETDEEWEMIEAELDSLNEDLFEEDIDA